MNDTVQKSPSQNFRLLAALPWLALVYVASRYWQVWDRLPARMATHFDASGRPNGWMSREVALGFMLGVLVFVLIAFTLILARVRRTEAGSWAFLALFGLAAGTICWINESLLAYNLEGNPVQVGPVLIVTFLTVLIVIAVLLGSKRGVTLPGTPVITEEVHAVPAWALVFALPLLIELAAMVAIRNTAVRIGLGFGLVLFSTVAAGAFRGFQYVFTDAGLEVRTLGFRLRSIPSGQIKSYEISRWNPLGGYGIRGIGDRRAYVWGNRGVRIETTEGEVFLGHRRPERVIHDLDLMTHNHEARLPQDS
jgi:hypothetical protein